MSKDKLRKKLKTSERSYSVSYHIPLSTTYKIIDSLILQYLACVLGILQTVTFWRFGAMTSLESSPAQLSFLTNIVYL